MGLVCFSLHVLLYLHYLIHLPDIDFLSLVSLCLLRTRFAYLQACFVFPGFGKLRILLVYLIALIAQLTLLVLVRWIGYMRF